MHDNLSSTIDRLAEWLEADGLGGFASGTVGGSRTRRYHAVLLTSAHPPVDRRVYVNGFEATVVAGDMSWAISTQHYVPDVFFPQGHLYLQSFTDEPWPTWVYRLPNGLVLEYQLFVPRGYSGTVLKWQIRESQHDLDLQSVELIIRPFISGRDYHSLQHENPTLRFEAVTELSAVTGVGQIEWRPYESAAAIKAFTNGHYLHSPDWYRQFYYAEEAARGLESSEDLASPGELRFNLKSAPAVLVLTTPGPWSIHQTPVESVEQLADRLAEAEWTRRNGYATRLHRAAIDYIALRGNGRTIIAGYPWFTDWGRDTFIALRGLCLATGQLEDAGRILTAWAELVSEGMLPNRFPDQGEVPEYNAVDASLWYVIAAYDYLNASKISSNPRLSADRKILQIAVNQILLGYTQGTRFGIRAETDGLLSAGQQGVQLTWMDAKCGDWVVTPRIGKPVEVQALWINALWIGSKFNPGWEPLFLRARESFRERFWNPSKQCLYDVVDVDHQSGQNDDSIRPNQIFAVGGLPLNLLNSIQAQLVLQIVEDRLLTPLGLRTLEPAHSNYHGSYGGGTHDRDAAYHQGTVWPWLKGPFVDAWLRVRGHSTANRRYALFHFVQPLLDHIATTGIGHVSEIADGEGPHRPAGCPFQAWSLGELLRLQRMVAESAESAG